MRLETLPSKVFRKVLGNNESMETKNNMNPIGYYIHTNPELKNWIDKYIKDNIDRVADAELREDVLSIANGNKSIDKIEVVTLLSALKIFY